MPESFAGAIVESSVTVWSPLAPPSEVVALNPGIFILLTCDLEGVARQGLSPRYEMTRNIRLGE